MTRGSAIDVFDMAELSGHYRSVTGFESACLLAFALAVFLAGLVLAGQAIARLVAASAEELRLATALGLTRFQGTAAAVAGPAAAAAGAAVGVALAIIASRWMPFGVAATKEPDPGMTADWLVLGSGLALFPALAVGVAAAWLALGRVGGGRAARRSAVAQVAVRAGLPVSAVVGVRFALEPGRGANTVPARAALLGAVSGVLGVIAALPSRPGCPTRPPTRPGSARTTSSRRSSDPAGVISCRMGRCFAPWLPILLLPGSPTCGSTRPAPARSRCWPTATIR